MTSSVIGKCHRQRLFGKDSVKKKPEKKKTQKQGRTLFRANRQKKTQKEEDPILRMPASRHF
jgi:hypothetical protein